MGLSLRERARLYNEAFPQYPDSHLRASDRWLQGQWVLGNNYRGSGMFGSYPPEYLKRMAAIFPDAERTLHLLSGSLPQQATRRCVTLDLRHTPEVVPGVRGDVHALPFRSRVFDLGYADPPYTDVYAARYDTPMIDRRKVLYQAHRVIEPGGFLVWLDMKLPIYAKAYWQWVGAIAMWRSSNHWVRGIHIFERMPHASDHLAEGGLFLNVETPND